ncbi:Gfo/Idh/MocA family protein [Tundrisphaera lichenicola]|uniref:Gfo/Idh/MocA family protein n=1 Tax=Tundrisphaera lichenicola TaxID=2029860 RepID=UPI003EB8DA84
MSDENRREFLRRGARAVGVGGIGYAFPMIVNRRVLGGPDVVPPSERIRVGFIGVGRQGTANIKAIQKQKAADVVAASDVDQNHLAAARKVAESGGRPCTGHADYRKLLDDQSIDAVLISTPDHWHALTTIDTCAAGKDVYCEKPLGLTIAEGKAMVEAARKAKRIVQTGSQQRSDARFRLACELVRSGRLGKIKSVRTSLPKVNFDGPAVADSTPPPELDYQTWLGPAPERPYNVKHVHYLFRFFWDYSGGQMTNFGAHHLDIAQWGLGRDESGPVSIEGSARYNKDGWFEVPEQSEIVYTYDDGIKLYCNQGMGSGPSVLFEGEKGSISVSRGKIESNPPEILKEPLKTGDVHLYASEDHHKNWLDCIKSRELPICDVAIGHRSATVCHLGNIAARLGRKLNWDPTTETIVGDTEAADMLSRTYRAPWHLPESTARVDSARRG